MQRTADTIANTIRVHLVIAGSCSGVALGGVAPAGTTVNRVPEKAAGKLPGAEGPATLRASDTRGPRRRLRSRPRQVRLPSDGAAHLRSVVRRTRGRTGPGRLRSPER